MLPIIVAKLLIIFYIFINFEYFLPHFENIFFPECLQISPRCALQKFSLQILNEQKGWFISMFLGTLGASLFGNMLAGRGTSRAGEGIN